jgi:hypothetical protein
MTPVLRPRTIRIGLALLFTLGGAAAHAAPAGFAFLEIPTGGRLSALGGGGATLSSGVEALFWNPAGLSHVEGLEVAGAHAELVQGLRHDAFAMAGRAFGGGLGASFRALYSEPIEERDALGNLIGSFGAHDLEFSLAYARRAGAVEAGVSAQAVRERIANEATTPWSVGLGGAWEPPALEGLRLGASVEHLGPAANYTIDDSEGEPVELPTAVQAGASWRRRASERFISTGALEGRFTRGRQGVGILALELEHTAGAALRAGYRANDDATSFSMGAGWKVGELRLDYAWVPFRLDLGDTHRFSFTGRF